jgi:hypothetical protein
LAWQDVGQAVLESYSRILESLAFTVLSRVDDVLYADCLTQNPLHSVCARNLMRESSGITDSEMFESPSEENNFMETAGLMTLSDFMGWGVDQGSAESNDITESSDEASKDGEGSQQHVLKLANIITNKKSSYLESLGGLRSPTARH